MGVSAAFPANPARRLPIPRVDDLLGAEACRRVEAKQPFVARLREGGLLGWSKDHFQRVLGAQKRELIRTSDGQRVTLSVAELLDVMDAPDWKSRLIPTWGGGPIFKLNYIAGSQPGPEVQPLVADVVRLPFIPQEDFQLGVMIRNSAADGTGTYYTECHWEHTAMPTVNLQVQGKKHVWLFAPDQTPHLGVTSGLLTTPHLSVGADACHDPARHDELAKAWCYEAVLEPGDALYWPEFWFHWFVHAPTYQINAGYYWIPEDLRLSPVSASWAFSTALVGALGGYDKAAEALAALPEDVRELLVRIEQTMLTHPELQDPLRVIMARLSASAVLPTDTRKLR